MTLLLGLAKAHLTTALSRIIESTENEDEEEDENTSGATTSQCFNTLSLAQIIIKGHVIQVQNKFSPQISNCKKK